MAVVGAFYLRAGCRALPFAALREQSGCAESAIVEEREGLQRRRGDLRCRPCRDFRAVDTSSSGSSVERFTLT